MTCAEHPWSLPTQRGCLTCGWSEELNAIQAEQDARAEKQAMTVRRRNAAIAERTRQANAVEAFGRLQSGRTVGTHRLREAARKLREKAIPMLRRGMRPVEVDAKIGKHRGWCSKSAELHPEMRNAIRAGKARRRAERIEARDAELAAKEIARPSTMFISEDEVRGIVARHHAGETLTGIAGTIGRHFSSVHAAYHGWMQGTSRLAKRAKDAGTWDAGSEAAE